MEVDDKNIEFMNPSPMNEDFYSMSTHTLHNYSTRKSSTNTNNSSVLSVASYPLRLKTGGFIFTLKEFPPISDTTPILYESYNHGSRYSFETTTVKDLIEDIKHIGRNINLSKNTSDHALQKKIALYDVKDKLKEWLQSLGYENSSFSEFSMVGGVRWRRGVKRRKTHRRKKVRSQTRTTGSKQKGGFYPSVMGGVERVALLTPVALRLGSQLLNSTRSKHRGHTRRQRN